MLFRLIVGNQNRMIVGESRQTILTRISSEALINKRWSMVYLQYCISLKWQHQIKLLFFCWVHHCGSWQSKSQMKEIKIFLSTCVQGWYRRTFSEMIGNRCEIGYFTENGISWILLNNGQNSFFYTYAHKHFLVVLQMVRQME